MIIITKNCSKNCLSCSETGTCSLCDFEHDKVLENGVCVQKSKINNCLFEGPAKKCLQCDSGYYPSSNYFSCFKLDENQFLPDCKIFLNNKCVLCNEGMFFNGYSCQSILKQISNCEYYHPTNPQKCLKCLEGYYLIDDKCEIIKNSADNCAAFSSFECKECSQSFLLSENASLSYLLKSENYFNFFSFANLSFFQIPERFCETFFDNLCENYKSGVCTKCKPNSMMIDSKCFILPQNQINNCKKYFSDGSCRQCSDSFYLDKFNNSCEKIETIEFCKKYSSDSIFCIECISTHYISKINQCIQRQNKINNCSQLSLSGDYCEECIENYILSNDFMICSARITNCQEHLPFYTFNSNLLLCYKCKDEYFLSSENICEKVKIENCKKIFGNTCNECIQGYFIHNNICYPHDSIPFCLHYSPFIKNKCEVFSNNFFQLKINSVCLTSEYISKCKVYDSSDISVNISQMIITESKFLEKKENRKCTICESGFEPSEDQLSCQVIYSIQFCQQIIHGKCIECQDNYYLTHEGHCTHQSFYSHYNCQYPNMNFFLPECLKCVDNSIITDFKGFVCQNNLENPIQNCESYSSFDFSCISCKTGFSLKDSECVEDSLCAFILKDPRTNFKNEPYSNFGYLLTNSVCLETSPSDQIPNCQIFVPGKTSLNCSQCQPEHTGIVLIDSFIPSFYNLNSTLESPISSLYSFNKCIPDQSLSLIQNCELYIEKEDNSVGCSKCQFGYSGTPNNLGFISNCIEMVDECNADIIYNGLGFSEQEQSALNYSLGIDYN